MASSHCPDLILLDLSLPGMDGTEVIRRLREWSGTPILVVSARDQEEEKVRAFDLGADDYITKPFGTSELLARIRAARRHANQLAAERALVSPSYEYQDFRIDFERRAVTVGGKEIHLTQNEYKIVERLARQPAACSPIPPCCTISGARTRARTTRSCASIWRISAVSWRKTRRSRTIS